MLKQIEPAGCSEVPDSHIEKLWDNPSWIAERKYDGGRYLCHVGKTGLRFTSRRQSVKDGLYVEKTDKVPHLAEVNLPALEKTVLDGELIIEGGMSSDVFRNENVGKQKYMVFDVILLKGEDMTDEPFIVRRQCLEELFTKTKFGKHIILVEQHTNSREFCNVELKAGKEGVILKQAEAKYGKGWVKVKRKTTFDVIVTGYDNPSKETEKTDGTVSLSKYYKEGWIGAIKFGMYFKGKVVELGQTSGMSEKVRKAVSEHKQKYLGKVMEVEAQEILISGALRHPRFVGWREDKAPKDCKLERYKAWVDLSAI